MYITALHVQENPYMVFKNQLLKLGLDPNQLFLQRVHKEFTSHTCACVI